MIGATTPGRMSQALEHGLEWLVALYDRALIVALRYRQVTLAVTGTQRLLVNSSGRALIKTSQSCGVAVPLTAVLYGTAGTVVQVVRRDRVETKQVEVGLMSGGQVEIRDGLVEGDMVVARAGAILREGDPVRAVTMSADGK